MIRSKSTAVVGALALAASLAVGADPPALANSSPATVLYTAPTGSGSACTQQSPCSLTEAQQAVRAFLAGGGTGGIEVLVGDGIYRLGSGLQFGPADSGSSGNPVIWQAAPGAHPTISGGTQVTGWTESDPTAGIWSAKVPAGSATRQLFIDGKSAPVAQASVGSLGLALGSWGSSGFTTSGSTATWFSNLASQIGSADVPGVQFEFNPMSPADWEESSCPLSSIGSGTITMAQPCWNNLTNKTPTIWGGNSSNITPYSLSSGTAPTTILNAYPLLHPGQWYLDQPTDTLYYMPTPGQNVNSLDVELPQLQSLMQVTGTLADPVHDLTFQGLTFTTATWLQPSTDVGFAQVQANLNITGAANQGECTYAAGAAGTCPWGAFSQPLANIQLTAAGRITFEGDTFTDLGGIGLGAEYGSDDNLIQGSTFTQIASSAIWLGCGGDPDPTDPSTDPPSAVIADCSAGGAASNDTIGTNEIMTGNTVDDNVIYDDAAGYDGAAGVTLMFTQHTTISHNDIFNMPYDGITSGAWQGHPDAASWTNTTNINAYNAITDNLFHNNMQEYGDGGDIYTEGNQGVTVYNSDGSIDTAASYTSGTTITGNVTDTDTPHNSYAVAPDVGSQWITLTGNVEWNSHNAMSSNWPTPTDPYSRSYQNWYADPDDHPNSPGEYDNTQIPETPGPADLPISVLAQAGVQGPYQALEAAAPASVYYTGTSPASGSTPAQELIAGSGLTPDTVVYIGGVPASSVQFVSSGFLIADIPAGANGTSVSLTPPGPITGYQGMCVDARGGSSTDGTPVQVYGCNGTAAQQWTVPGDGTLTAFGKCLDVTSGATTDGTLVELWDCNGGANQQWIPQADGELVSAQSGKCLDDTAFGGSGTQLEIWDCNGGTNQQWALP